MEVKGTELLNKKRCTEPSALLLASLPSPSKESKGLRGGEGSSIVSCVGSRVLCWASGQRQDQESTGGLSGSDGA